MAGITRVRETTQSKQARTITPIPDVPHRTPMFDTADPAGWPPLSRTWMIFFERIGRAAGQGAPDEFWRTLDVKDSIPGDDIADRLVAQGSGAATRVRAVLRKAITADLTVRINLDGDELTRMTIPLATAPGVALEQLFSSQALIAKGQVFSWDIIESDSSADIGGIASFTIEWEMPPDLAMGSNMATVQNVNV